MRFSPLAAALATVVIAAPLASHAQVSGWKTYSYPDVGLSFSAPSEPQVKDNSVPTDDGKSIGMKVYAFKADDSHVYVITASNVSSIEGASTATADSMAQSVMDGALDGASPLSQRPATWPKGAARDFTILAEGNIMRMKVIYVYPWAYSVMVITPQATQGAKMDAQAEAFLKTVRVSK